MPAALSSRKSDDCHNPINIREGLQRAPRVGASGAQHIQEINRCPVAISNTDLRSTPSAKTVFGGKCPGGSAKSSPCGNIRAQNT